MRVEVRAKPGSASDQVIEDEGGITVRLRAKAVDGAANEALLVLVARHYRVPKSAVTLLRGHRSRVKLIEISGP